MTNRQAFATALAVLGNTFDRKLTAPAIEGYWIALGDLTEGEFAVATKRALEGSKFMPTPAELLAFAGKARNVTAEAASAWEAVRGAIRLHDYTVASIDFGPLVNTVLRCMGSWEWLCEQGADDMVWRQKDFERFYVAFAQGSDDALRAEPLRGWGFGRIGCQDVRMPIGGKLPPLALPSAPNPVRDVVRELADAKSQTGVAATASAGREETRASTAVPPPLRETVFKAPPMAEAEVEARKAAIRAQMAARGVTLPESVEVAS